MKKILKIFLVNLVKFFLVKYHMMKIEIQEDMGKSYKIIYNAY
jgi:hypothetical protein